MAMRPLAMQFNGQPFSVIMRELMNGVGAEWFYEFTGEVHDTTRGKCYRFRSDCEECLADAWEHMADHGVQVVDVFRGRTYAHDARFPTRIVLVEYPVSPLMWVTLHYHEER